MCFRKTSKIKKAKVDIVCYKVGQYVDATTNKTDDFFLSGIRGYAYRTRKKYKLKNWRFSQFFNITKYINRGYHSFKHLEVAYLNNSISCSKSIVECIILKGSYYYENTLGEYISNQIIINKRIEQI